MNAQEKKLWAKIEELRDYIKNYLSNVGDTMNKKIWYQQKTVWAAVLLAGTVVLPQFIAMTPAQIEAIRTLLVAITAIFLRDSIEKSKIG